MCGLYMHKYGKYFILDTSTLHCMTLTVFCEKYVILRSFSTCIFLQTPIRTTLLLQIFSATVCCQTLALSPPLRVRGKIRTAERHKHSCSVNYFNVKIHKLNR
jgi:hypothetical protein